VVHPFVTRIRVFPIKSLDPVDLEAGHLLTSGALAFDRRWAIVDENGRFVNGKRTPLVHKIRSFTDLQTHSVRLWTEDGAVGEQTYSLGIEREGVENWLSRVFEFPVFLKGDEAVGFPDDTNSPGPTLISTATLRAIGQWCGLSLEEARARFRTNIEIDGCAPFWEDALFGPRGSTVPFRIGNVHFEGVNPCQRCIVPTRDSRTGVGDGQFVPTFRKLREQTLPSWSARTQFNHFYRVAVNTRLATGGPDSSVCVGDEIAHVGM
jgi:uncharacterized protein YcbX